MSQEPWVILMSIPGCARAACTRRARTPPIKDPLDAGNFDKYDEAEYVVEEYHDTGDPWSRTSEDTKCTTQSTKLSYTLTTRLTH